MNLFSPSTPPNPPPSLPLPKKTKHVPATAADFLTGAAFFFNAGLVAFFAGAATTFFVTTGAATFALLALTGLLRVAAREGREAGAAAAAFFWTTFIGTDFLVFLAGIFFLGAALGLLLLLLLLFLEGATVVVEEEGWALAARAARALGLRVATTWESGVRKKERRRNLFCE